MLNRVPMHIKCKYVLVYNIANWAILVFKPYEISKKCLQVTPEIKIQRLSHQNNGSAIFIKGL